MHIFLVRHGHRVLTPPDPELTEQGHKQAKLTGEWLKQYPISKVVSSPFKRTIQTAQGILQSFNSPFEIRDNLQERMEYDPTKHATFGLFLQEWLQASKDRAYQPSVGRSSDQAGNEVKQIIEEFGQEQHSHLVLVSHGGTIADFLRTVLQEQSTSNFLIPVEYKEHSLEIHDNDYIVNHCSITHLESIDNTWIAHMINNVDHLGSFSSPAP